MSIQEIIIGGIIITIESQEHTWRTFIEVLFSLSSMEVSQNYF